MLETALKDQLRTIFAPLDSRYTFLIRLNPRHENRNELIELLEDVASCSEKINYRLEEGEGLEFELLKNEQKTRIKFRGIPNGHEFTSLLLAILNSDGKGKNILTETYSSLEGTDPVNYLCILNMYELSGCCTGLESDGYPERQHRTRNGRRSDKSSRSRGSAYTGSAFGICRR